MNHLPEEHYIARFKDRNTRRGWEKKGKKDAISRAREKVDRILASHKPEPLEKNVVKKLEEIRRRAQKESGT